MMSHIDLLFVQIREATPSPEWSNALRIASPLSLTNAKMQCPVWNSGLSICLRIKTDFRQINGVPLRVTNQKVYKQLLLQSYEDIDNNFVGPNYHIDFCTWQAHTAYYRAVKTVEENAGLKTRENKKIKNPRIWRWHWKIWESGVNSYELTNKTSLIIMIT